MLRYTLTRIAWALPTVLAIVTVGFFLTRVLPGDPVQVLIGDFPAPPEYVEQIRERYGLNEPLHVQYWLFLQGLVTGDLGFSFANNSPVLPLLLERALATLALMVPALTLASLLGIFFGAVGARRPGSALDTSVTVFTVTGQSVPVFWLGMLLVLGFSIQLGWFPVTGMTSLFRPDGFAAQTLDYLHHLMLPCLTLTLAYMTVVARVSRSSMIEAGQQDYVLTAAAKGLSQRQVMRGHILRNSMIPIVTVIGFNFGYSLTGAVLTETVFGWPGLGSLFVQSVTNRDYPVIVGVFLLSAITVVVVNFLVDLLYALINPRIRRSHGHV